jgi:DNA-binding PadR family transcriptional regulator
MTENNSETDERHARRGGPHSRPGFAGRDGFGEGSHEWPDRGFGGRGRGGFGALRDSFGFGGGRERLFDAGDFKLVILKLLSEQPGYGYQLIKTMEQRLAGGYAPSAGVVYPTLTMLEEEGFTSVSSENGKKIYSVTPEGQQYLETNKGRVKELFDRLEEAGRGFQRGRSPEIMKAFFNLRNAVVARVTRESVTPEQISKITETINAAARTIDEL